MTTSDLYAKTLSDLTALRATMLSTDWQAALDNETPEVRLDAARTLIKVQQAIGAMANATLSDIAKDMEAQQDDLAKAAAGLDQALADITRVSSVLSAITQALNVVAKIVPLI